MKFSQLAALATAAAFAVPAAAQLNLPIGKQKEVQKLSKSDIAKEMVFKKGDIDKCLEEHKKKEPKVTGTFAARFNVDTGGNTTDIQTVSTQTSAFGSCMQGKIKGWTFSKAKEKS